ncbi:MAG TPA: DUF6702 family protein [Pyrinomonadaceae bacterium]|jgi:hypothetical protein
MNAVRKNTGLRLKRGFIFAFLLLPFAFLCAEAHTYHTSLTRMDYNARDKNIEISIQLFIHDAVPMLERRLKKRVDIEKTAGVDAEMLKYLSETFVFQNNQGEPQKLRWVGREFENDVVHVFVEIPFAESLEGGKLQNTIFFESYPQQANLVVARFGEKKIDLLYKAGDKFKDL